MYGNFKVSLNLFKLWKSSNYGDICITESITEVLTIDKIGTQVIYSNKRSLWTFSIRTTFSGQRKFNDSDSIETLSKFYIAPSNENRLTLSASSCAMSVSICLS